MKDNMKKDLEDLENDILTNRKEELEVELGILKSGQLVNFIAYQGSNLVEAMATNNYIQSLIDTDTAIEGKDQIQFSIKPMSVDMLVLRGEVPIKYTVKVEGVGV